MTARFGLPLILSELGASAGLNLIWDYYRLDIGQTIYGPKGAQVHLNPEWRGQLSPIAPPIIASRAGVDLNPLDPAKDRQRLLSYIWADQTDRLDRTADAISVADRLGHRIDQGDAIDWLEQRLGHPFDGAIHLIYHTIAWQYFPKNAQKRGAALITQAGQRATATAPIAHLSMEADSIPGSAALHLTLWPSGEDMPLGRADYHGRWIDWRAPSA